MKKYLLVATVSLSFVFAGCGYQGNNKTVEDQLKKVEEIDTAAEDDQKEIGRIDADVEIFEFEEAVAKSDLIAEIEIVDVLKEINEPSPKTIFRAVLTESLKGSSQSEEIFVMQQGNSDYVFNENPLFKQGENYLLFLMETEGFDIEDSYWILGEETGMYKLLGQSTAVKLSVKEGGLEGIEITDEKIMPFIEQETELDMNEREMQVLKEDELKSLIKKISVEDKK